MRDPFMRRWVGMPDIFNPRPYQAAGIDLILDNEDGVLLAIEPGGGKTVVAWTAANLLVNDYLAFDHVLIVGPKLVAQEVWSREQMKWDSLAHLNVFQITAATFDYEQRVTTSAVLEGECRTLVKGAMSKDDEDFLMMSEVAISETELRPRDPSAVRAEILGRPERFHVVSRDHFFVLAKLMGKKWPYRMVIWDESTSLKNHESKRHKAVAWLRKEKLITKLVLLTGTPAPKGLEQLWAQVKLLDGGKRLGKFITHFRAEYMLPDGRNREGRIFSYKAKPGAVDRVMSKIKDICLAVQADIWRQNEPPRTVQRIVTLPEAAMDLYRQMEEDSVIELDGCDIMAPQAAVLRGKLLQMSSGAVLDADKVCHSIHEAKLDALEELLEELDGEPVMLLYWHKASLPRLKERFGSKLGTTKSKGFLDRFGSGKMPILALQPAGAGHGLDGLQTGSHHVVVYELQDDWELYKQAVDRIDRSGQVHQVTIHQLVASSTVDVQVARRLAERHANHRKVMGAVKWVA